MDLNIFKPDDSDRAFIAYIKREALSGITCHQNGDVKQYWYDYYKALMELCKASAESIVKDSYDFISNIISKQDYLRYNIPLYPIDITKNDFEIIDNEILCHHKRSFDLVWISVHKLTDEKSIYYRNAYSLQIKKTFDFIEKKVYDKKHNDLQYTIFISKGGVINGDFIDFIFIRTKDYEKGNLRLNLPINIPVCEVFFKDKDDNKSLIYAVDRREPNLKLLMEKYNCPICNNTEIKELKLNLRYCTNDIKKTNYDNIIFKPLNLNEKNDYRVTEENQRYDLHCKLGVIASIKDGHLTVYYSKIRYKKIDHTYFTWFTGYTLDQLKRILNSNNQNITFV